MFVLWHSDQFQENLLMQRKKEMFKILIPKCQILKTLYITVLL